MPPAAVRRAGLLSADLLFRTPPSAVGRAGLLCAVLLFGTALSCMETARGSGRLPASEVLQVVTLSGPASSSCTCCALCYRQPACASFSFNPPTAECELYSSVASYVTFQPKWEKRWRYFVMPGRSETGQFCRQDSDCLEEEDTCRGRVCTDLNKVTCATLAETFAIGGNSTAEPCAIGANSTRDIYYGWLDNEEFKMKCQMPQEGRPNTLLFINERGFEFNDTTILEFNKEMDKHTRPYSILGKAEKLRCSGTDLTYQLEVKFQKRKGSSRKLLLKFQVPCDVPVLSDRPRDEHLIWKHSSVSWNVSMPWMPKSGPILLTTSCDDNTELLDGALARRDGEAIYYKFRIFILD